MLLLNPAETILLKKLPITEIQKPYTGPSENYNPNQGYNYYIMNKMHYPVYSQRRRTSGQSSSMFEKSQNRFKRKNRGLVKTNSGCKNKRSPYNYKNQFILKLFDSSNKNFKKSIPGMSELNMITYLIL